MGRPPGAPTYGTVRPVKRGIHNRQRPLVPVASAIRRGVEPGEATEGRPAIMSSSPSAQWCKGYAAECGRTEESLWGGSPVDR